MLMNIIEVGICGIPGSTVLLQEVEEVPVPVAPVFGIMRRRGGRTLRYSEHSQTQMVSVIFRTGRRKLSTCNKLGRHEHMFCNPDLCECDDDGAMCCITCKPCN